MKIIGYKFNLEEAEKKYEELDSKYSAHYYSKGREQVHHFKQKNIEYKNKIEILELNRGILKTMKQNSMKLNNNSQYKGKQEKKSYVQRSLF